jgi:hypothetical protein
MLLAAVVLIWIIAVGGGMTRMWRYASQPGEAARPPVTWPVASHLHHNQGQLTLVMFVHPHCTCSRATIGELAKLMARSANRVQAFVIFVQPPKVAESWSETDLWKSVTLIHGVTRVLDNGTQARRFGAMTSGQTVVYDTTGKLLFAGGITASRGHFGDNRGVTSIIALMGQSQPVQAGNTPVYGCPLFSARSKKGARPETCHR